MLYAVCGMLCMERVARCVSNGRASAAATRWIEMVGDTTGTHGRVYVIHNFMTPEEAQHLMDLAKPKLARATVVGWVLTSAQLSHLGGVARCSSPT